jgi:hypothetical protein
MTTNAKATATKCLRCNRPLRNTISVARGMGQVCWDRAQAEAATPAPKATAAPAPVAAPAPRRTIAEQVADAYAALAPEAGAWVGLAALRGLVAGTKAEQDAVMVQLERDRTWLFAPETAQHCLTLADRAAAVRIGWKDKHNLRPWN